MVKKQVKEHFKPYCGADEVPKGYRVGNMKECTEKKQVRLYGIKKIDKKTFQLQKKILKDKKELPETREKLLLLLAGLRGKIRTLKVRSVQGKDKKIKDTYKKELKQAENKLNKVIPKLQKIEKQRESLKKKKLSKKGKGILPRKITRQNLKNRRKYM